MKEFERLNQYFEKLVNRPELMWLGRNTNHLPSHSHVINAMVKCIEKESYHVYSPPYGLEDLRRLVIEQLGLDDMSALITDGAVSGLYHVCHKYLRPNDELITTDPTWEWTIKFAEAAGATVRQLDIYGKEYAYRLTPDRLSQAVNENTKCIYLIDPNNPLGTSCTEEETEEIANIAQSVDAYLIQDCTYRDFAFEHNLAAKYYPERTITIWSFSKWLGFAGLRIGAVVANPNLIEDLSEAPPNILGSSVIAQHGALAGLETRSEWFPQVLTITRENQKLVHDAVKPIPQVSLPVYPSNGNFVIVECADAGIAPESICKLMDQRNIMVRQGSYHTKKFGDRFIKVSLSVPQEWVVEFCEALPDVIEQAQKEIPDRQALMG